MARKLKSLTIFFPVLNDSRAIADLIHDTFEVAPRVAHRFDVLVIDDGSTDETAAVLQQLRQRYSELRIAQHVKNLGYGTTLRDGISAAKGEFVFYTDGDGQYDVKELPLLVKQLDQGVDFVNGTKITRHDSLVRIVVGTIYQKVMKRLFQLPIDDVDCDFRLMRTKLIQKLPLKSSSGAIGAELVHMANGVGAQFRQVPVHHYPRRYGRSQFFRIRALLTTCSEVMALIRGR
mgnify:CR=1 FL=1